MYAEKRRTLPDRVPVTHLSQADRRLIFEQEKPDRRLYCRFMFETGTRAVSKLNGLHETEM